MKVEIFKNKNVIKYEKIRGNMTLDESDEQLIGEFITGDLIDFVTLMGSGFHPNRQVVKFMLLYDELFLGCLYSLKESEEKIDENDELTLNDFSQDTERGGGDTKDLLITLRKPYHPFQ